MPIIPIRAVKIGTISSVGAKLKQLVSGPKTVEKRWGHRCSNDATPSIVRIPSLKGS